MNEKNFNIFKIEYSWVEGEYDSALVGKEVVQEEFEKDLAEARRFAESLIGKKVSDGDYLGKGYETECKPAFYEQILWFLTEKKKYVYCYFDEELTYEVDDDWGKKILLKKEEKCVKRSNIS